MQSSSKDQIQQELVEIKRILSEPCTGDKGAVTVKQKERALKRLEQIKRDLLARL